MKLRVATLNVWALPGPFATDVSRRMQAIGSHLETLAVDVVAFQEVWTEEARETLLGAGRRAGFEHAFHQTESFGGSGLLTLSKLPIESVAFERFRVKGQPDKPLNGEYLSGKGFAVIELRTPLGIVTVVNTHLHARYTRAQPHGYGPHRTAQLIQLASALARTQGPVVVLGDFNFGEQHPEYQVFTGLTGLRDVAAVLDDRAPTVDQSLFYRRHSRKQKRVDLVFVRDGRERAARADSVDRIFDEAVEFDGRPAGYSNHAGVLAAIDLSHAPGLVQPTLRRDVIATASRLLNEGRLDAEQRREDGRALAGMGLGCALIASVGVRSLRLSRRSFLRNSVRTAAVVGLTPALGYSVMLSELVAPGEIDAFEDAAESLAKFEVEADPIVHS